jgi:DNA-binding NarL/FixJ family response regulator
VSGAGLAALVLGDLSRAARRPAEPGTPSLTTREIEVLRLVAKGLSAKDAAARLGVSPRTVQNHVHNVLSKLQLRNRASWPASPSARATTRSATTRGRRVSGSNRSEI